MLAAAGELAERLIQILINTLSFARVGAFALAHAGLSSAIVALMARDRQCAAGRARARRRQRRSSSRSKRIVVSIQTTRLVLFEFFTRFLTAEGRIFHPLPAPPSMPQENG